ncbi:Flp pilus assembly protein CpaB [Fimbriiglobus ruber]|uniref:Flp pilus assembly protein RcpC/CpaB domain-containing protein n=1 Tax=Fimbriiglobus ruber TaxID=1908690 RepID=A0A225E2G8_9BACT|nr:Flp pilus assembly protein CpaB [Fimbriiglobus ruber]OWK44978.1 hypothetical protein FRUB_01309 [Fimbriiglobus ruber]
MRASFFLVLAVALLVGLGVAVAVKALGLLAVPTVAPLAQPVVAEPRPPVTKILVAARNLYAGDTILPGDVAVRAIRPDEVEAYEKNKADYVQPMPDAVHFRYPSANIEADTPMFRSKLKAMAKPDALHTRLAPGTRAVNIGATKPESAGGLIQVDDWIDVYISTDVARSDEPGRNSYSGLLVRHAQVIAKRDTLWPVFAGQPGETTIQYTLATNPYRAGLIEFARAVGVLSLVPVSETEKKRLDAVKASVMTDPAKAPLLFTANPESELYREEERRIREYERGTLSLSGDDLAAVLNLKPIPAPPEGTRLVSVDLYNGVRKQNTVAFGQTAPPGRYVFTMPGATPPLTTGATGPKYAGDAPPPAMKITPIPPAQPLPPPQPVEPAK